MLRTIGDQLPFLRPQTLVGQDVRTDILSGMDHSAQRDVAEEFRLGKVNLLVATRVAEDGVELPPCTCVIRYVGLMIIQFSCLVSTLTTSSQ